MNPAVFTLIPPVPRFASRFQARQLCVSCASSPLLVRCTHRGQVSKILTASERGREEEGGGREREVAIKIIIFRVRRWPATNAFVDDYRAFQVVNFARFDFVVKRKKKGKGKINNNFRHLIGKWKRDRRKTSGRIDGIISKRK